MSEVLSQNEIDNLLAALSTGDFDATQMADANEKQVKNYDFKRPSKFSKEHLRTLEIIYEHYGRLLSTNLPVYLRKTVQVAVASSETVTFSEFTNALASPSILGIINFHPLNGTVILDMAPNLGFAIIDRMLGGQGEALERTRDFSEIEMTILQKMMVVCMQLMRDPWKNVVEINPVLDRIETNPAFAQIISPSDMIAIVTLNVKIGDTEGFFNICLPFFTLEDVMDKLNTKFWFSNMTEVSGEEYSDYLEAMIRHVDIPIRAILGTSSISVGDFVNLMPGDVIRVNSDMDSELDIYVGNIRKFTGLPGYNRDKFAMKITTVIREED